MQLKNNARDWGLVSRLFHWLSALVIFGLFALGLWMVDLDYYHAWYRTAPDIHRSVGILLFLVTGLRLVWRACNRTPAVMTTHQAWEQELAHLTHVMLYLILIAIMISGYLISTADGRGVQVFDWFEIPASLHGIKNQEDIAGDYHFALAWLLIALVVLHSAGALKHHFIDRDATLKRMLGSNTDTNKP